MKFFAMKRLQQKEGAKLAAGRAVHFGNGTKDFGSITKSVG